MAIQLLFVLSLFVGPFVSIKAAPAGQQTQKARDPYKDILGPIPERKLSQRDLGVDYAVVTVSYANLRDTPSITSNPLLKLARGDILVILGSALSDTWYNVIHVESGQEGWIHSSTVEVNYTQNRKPLVQIPRTATGSSKNPALEVTNDTNRILTLKIEDTRYTFAPHEKQTLNLAPGHYKFIASAPAVIPDFGEESLETGYSYSWRFYIMR